MAITLPTAGETDEHGWTYLGDGVWRMPAGLLCSTCGYIPGDGCACLVAAAEATRALASGAIGWTPATTGTQTFETIPAGETR